MSEPKEFLGQDLMRDAMDARSLEVFEEPAAVMRDGSRSIWERNDAFTAVRFGLAGLILRAWEPTIVSASKQPFMFGGGQIGHEFAESELFQPHDAELVDLRRSTRVRPAVAVTQGDFAFTALAGDLQRSMAKVVEAPHDHAAGGITVAETLDSIVQHVELARDLCLTTIPDAYSAGTPITEDFYGANRGGKIDLLGIVEVARNPIRFMWLPSAYIMESNAATATEQTQSGWEVVTQATEDYNQQDIDSMLLGVMKHAARASQRNDANRTVVGSEGIRSNWFTTGTDRRGRPEVSWPGKRLPPIRRLPVGEFPPATGMVSNRRRNKCPIGYTEQAGDPMPILNIYEAIVAYMVKANLNDPRFFMSPKTLEASLSSVR